MIYSGAQFSPCGLYRYSLERQWSGVNSDARVVYIMLNPSTADAQQDDATIRVCMGRARRLGYSGITVVNLFALRATDPKVMLAHPHPISDPGDPGRNEWEITAAIHCRDMVICAWGRHGGHLRRDEAVLEALRHRDIKPWALKLNADGRPAHPLRIPYSQPFVRI